MHKFLIYLSIYFCLTCFGLSFSPSSEAGVQLRQWFKFPGYGVSVRAPYRKWEKITILCVLKPKIQTLLYKRDFGNMELLCEYRIYKIQSAYIQGTETGHRPASREATIRLSGPVTATAAWLAYRVCQLISVCSKSFELYRCTNAPTFLLPLYWFLDCPLFCLPNKSITCSKATIKICFSVRTENRYMMANGRI
jgi:hypothetical protein